ncbi:MAG: enoyl-CoA hydratase/isomerase family protein [Sulfuricaulis sp.]|nr:enoyl-CoA hydratase/isomerase family protein [Sulfuricaulis sp.]
MDYKKLILDKQGPVTTITLNRPKVHNALDSELSKELNTAVRQVRADTDCRILIFRGAGDTFCAGDDIKGFNTWGPLQGQQEIITYQETSNMIDELVPITIAAVDGVCCGGGLELTLVCDFVIATDRSRWGMPEIDWDITPGWGGISRLPRFAGRRKAKEWNLIGALFDVTTAERYDLVNRICKTEELNKEVTALTDVLLAKHPVTLRRTKWALTHSFDMTVHQAMSTERSFPTNSMKSGGVSDFVEKDSREARRKLSKHFWQN